MSEPSLLERASPNRGCVSLVTGASGFLGGALVRRLLADGQRVRALVRSPLQARELARWGVEPVVGLIDDLSALAQAIRGVDIVYHMAGRLLVPGVSDEEYHRTNVIGTSLVIAAAREQAGLERLVYCSTTGVLGPTGNEPAGEDAPLAPSNIYEETKAEAEVLVRQAIAAALPAVIVRPGLVYGPGDLHLLGFYRAILNRRFRPIGHRPVWLHPIYIDDLTAALLLCGREAQAAGECFHLAGSQSVSLEYLADTIAAASGTSLPRGRIPMPAARAIAAFGDLLPGPLRKAAPLTRSRLAFLTHSRVYQVDKARRILGFAATTDLGVGVARTIEWYRSQGLLAVAATG